MMTSENQRPPVPPFDHSAAIRLRDRLQKQTTCPLKGSSPSRSFTRPKTMVGPDGRTPSQLAGEIFV